jgi:hypothetical protein
MKTSLSSRSIKWIALLAVLAGTAWPGTAWAKDLASASADGVLVWLDPNGYTDTLWIVLWALLFGFLTLTGPRVTLHAYSEYTGAFVAGAAAGAVLGEFQKPPSERNFVGAALGGALFGLLFPLVFLVIGPIGLYFAVAQPLLHRYDGADRALCCFDVGPMSLKNWDITADGRYVVVAGNEPEPFFGKANTRGRMYAVDLDRGRFVSWPQAQERPRRGLAFASIQISGFEDVVVSRDGLTAYAIYKDWGHDRHQDAVSLAHLYRAGQRPSGTPAVKRFRLNGFVGSALSVVEERSGAPFVLDVDPRASKAVASPDGSVVAVIVFPPKDEWSLMSTGWIEFWDVARRVKIKTYKIYLMPDEKSLQIRAATDGRRWVMVVDGMVKVFALSGPRRNTARRELQAIPGPRLSSSSFNEQAPKIAVG